MPTKLSQDQVENLNSDLDSLDLKDASLESKISVEDSINDDVDLSLQGQIDILKSTILSLAFGNRVDLLVDGDSLTVMTPPELPIPVISIEYSWYFDSNPAGITGTNFYTMGGPGMYYVEVIYTTNLGIYVISSDPVMYKPSSK